MSRQNFFSLLATVGLYVLALAVAYSAPSRESKQDYDLVKLMVDVLYEVEHKGLKEMNHEEKEQFVADCINGGLQKLYPHSAYISPRAYKQFDSRSEGKFGGVGIQVSMEGGQLVVISPIAGTPAYKAGVLAGDIILKVDDKSIDGMTMTEVVERIQGDPGEKVVLTVVHEGGKETVDIPIVRDIILIHSVLGDSRKPNNPEEWDYLLDKKNKIGYVRLTGFSKTAPEELKAVLEDLKGQGMRGLILDLRNNPGGLLLSAVEIADMFLDKGVIVTTKGRYYRPEIYKASPGTTLLGGDANKGIPVAVLVNRYSASASEILSAALQDHQRAKVIGERTYGKGSVQNVILLENGGALKLTTSSYRRPSGKNIHRFPDSKEEDEWGVLPDPGFKVELTLEERRDYLIDRSERDIIHANNGKEEPQTRDKKPFVDKVLEKGLEHIREEIARGKRSAA